MATVTVGNITTQVVNKMEETFSFWENTSDNFQDSAKIMTEKMVLDDIRYFVSYFLCPTVCLFGLPGNILSIITWSRPGMGSSTGRYLTGQAAANIGVLFMFLTCDTIQHWFPTIKYSVIYGTFFSYFGFPIFYLTAILSIWFTVGVTVDRYVMVCWITKAKKLCSEARATFGLFLITLNGFIVNIPHFVSFKPVYPDEISVMTTNNDTTAKTDQQKVAFTASEFTTGQGGQFYEFWIHCIILILGPWIVVFFMNIMIIIKISEANRRMADKKTSQAMKKSKESENQVTRLLLVVTFTFLFFIGYLCIIQCLWMEKPPNANLFLLSAIYPFGVTGVLFNSSFNFLLYCLTGRRFRLELLKILGLIKKDTLLSSYTDTSSSNISTTTNTSTTSNIITTSTGAVTKD